MRLFKLLLILVILLFAGATGYISVIIFNREAALEQISRYNIAWLASQATTEYARLEQRVSAFGMPKSNVDQDEVQLRLDIVVNRLKLLQSGQIEELLNAQPELLETVRELEDVVAKVQLLVDHLDEPGNPQKALKSLTALDVKLAGLAAAANTFSGRKVAEDQKQLLFLHWMFSGLAAGLILCGIALTVLLIWRNKLLTRAHGDLHALTIDLQKTTQELERANEEVHDTNVALQSQNQTLLVQDVVLRTQNERFDAALNNMSQSLCMVDARQRLIVCNRQYQELFGLDSRLVEPGTPFRAIAAALSTGSRAGSALEKLLIGQQSLIQEGRAATYFEDIGDGRTFSISHQPMSDGGWVATYEDVSERRRAEARIAHMAHHDALTDLPNRILFHERMNDAFARFRRTGEPFSILCFDLDRFKSVNDTLGHPVGDALLKAVAERLLRHARETDLVARLGGDEFAILMTGSDQPQEAQSFAVRVLELLSVPFEVEGHHISTGASIGIAVAPTDGVTSDQLLKNADMALYRAKADGRQIYRFFAADMDAEMQARRRIENCLREALANNEFELRFQPLVNLQTNAIASCEALIRWNHPELGSVPPSEFIPIAEDIGLIGAIGEWVLQKACMAAALWPKSVRVAVNLSPIQFKNADLDKTIERALSLSALPAERLEVEITESLFLESSDATRAILNSLRELGVRIALDDFGTGYSSLSYLRSYPFDKIKIDQCFIRDIQSGNDSLAIIKSVIGLGHSLGMITTAEGVETAAQLEKLREAGCSEAQGYYFFRPQTEVQLTQILGAGQAGMVRAA